MDREEAICILERQGKLIAAPEYAGALDMAISALRTQQTQLDRSRWEGCEWCNGRYCDNCFWQLKMKDKIRCERCVEKSEWTPIVSYCSNCGKPLTEGAWAELKRRIGKNDGTTYS